MKKLIAILCAALMVAVLSGSTFEVEPILEQVAEIVCAEEIIVDETPVEPPEITPEIEYETDTVEYQESVPEVTPVAVVVPATTLPEPETYIPATNGTGTGVYVDVPGFGYVESGGESHMTHAADMYENGNKVGIMG